jgi:hypothetical protein
VFSVESAPRLYNEDNRRADNEFRDSPELAVGRLIEEWKKDGNEAVGSWQLQQRIGSGVSEEISGRQFCTRVDEGRT